MGDLGICRPLTNVIIFDIILPLYNIHWVSANSVVIVERTYMNSVKNAVYKQKGKEIDIPSKSWVGIMNVQAAMNHLQWP